MKKYLFFIAAGVLGLCACTAIEPESIENQSTSRTTISIPMTSEDVALDPATKAYLNETSSTSWSYVWEDGDQLGFFHYRNGLLRNQGMAEVDKRPTSVNVIYNAADFKAGDAIYSYLYQPDAEAEIGSFGIINDDPDNLYLQIPTFQLTTSDPETYDYTEDLSFQIGNVSTKGFSGYKIVGTSDAVGTVPNSGTLSFKIVGYDRDLVYRTGPNTSDLHIDAYGNASVTVSFDPIQSVSNMNGSTTTQVKVYVDGFEDNYAIIPVTAKATCKDAIPIIGYISDKYKASITYSYSSSTPTGAVVNLQFHDEGLVKPYPVRNCMPCVSQKTTITSSHIQHPEDIQSAMTMYMLGSVVEFRCYSLDDAVAVGETLYGVSFSSHDGECAGICNYDLRGQSLELENMTETDIIAYDLDGLTLQEGKENYVSLYMVLAPGTYSATVTFITDQNAYILDMAAKDFKRATKKAINCNLAKFTQIPIDEYNPSAPEETEDEDEDF